MLYLFFASITFAQTFALTNVTVIPVTGPDIAAGMIVVEDGKITYVGDPVDVPSSIPVVDGQSGFAMPGIIDVHSHMGVYPWPGARAHGDGNEATAPVTARVRAEDSVKVEDPAFQRAQAGGVTSLMILPGSANLIGGETVTVKNRDVGTLAAMKFVSAPRGIKMACGENPKRVYGDEDGGPSTRMGSLAHMRSAFQAALDYREARTRKEPPPTNHNLEVLLDVIDGEVLVHVHCYRHDDIEGIYRVMDQFGIKVRSFQHALEAYKVRQMIIEHGTGIATWPDWWGFKMEAYDATPYNAAMFKDAGGVVALHSDSGNTVQRMYTEAAKMVRYGSSPQQALEMITLDPAKMLGIQAQVGSLETGKDADIALFSKHPLDSYTLVQKTWVDGELVYDRSTEGTPNGRP